jgi:hypothetical protein
MTKIEIERVPHQEIFIPSFYFYFFVVESQKPYPRFNLLFSVH